jgi:hypothetical protein
MVVQKLGCCQLGVRYGGHWFAQLVQGKSWFWEAAVRNGTLLLALITCVLLWLTIDNQLCGASDSETPVAAPGQIVDSDRPTKQPLHGGVSKLEAGATDQSSQSGVAGAGREPLQGHVDDRDWFRPSIHLHKGKLKSDDYRQIEFGVTGFVSTKYIFGRFPVVTKLFSGCPAEAAGVRLGDRIVQANHHVFVRSDMQPEFWRYIDGRAGTPVALTVLRGDHYMTFQIVRMNIEDLPSSTLRKEYERLMRKLGAPTD